MLARLPEHSATVREKALRAQWEQLASGVSRDPRFIRQLFALLQELEVAPEEATAFNLAPLRLPLALTLPAPASSRQVQRLLALAAGSASRLTVTGVPLNGPVIEAVKLFNQVGAALRWEEDGRIECSGETPTTGDTRNVLDKVVHAGDDALNLHLVLFQMATRSVRLKIIGESGLRFVDLAPLRRFLPQLGARLTSLVPGQEGLPARLEASGMLPEALTVPDDLAPEALEALLLTLPFWSCPVRVEFAAPEAARPVLDAMLPLYSLCGVSCTREGDTLCVTPGKVSVPDSPALDADPLLSAPLLALPAFCGGSVTLEGRWNANDPLAQALTAELDPFLTLSVTETGVTATARAASPAADAESGAAPVSPTGPAHTDFSALPDDLLPVALALLALRRRLADAALPAPVLPATADPVLVESFLAQLGLGVNKGELAALPAAPSTPWASPSCVWAMGLALGAFVRPQIKLTNPNVVTAHLPDFWNIYNALPAGPLEKNREQANTTPAAPQRRRVLAGYMPASEMPEPLKYDEDE